MNLDIYCDLVFETCLSMCMIVLFGDPGGNLACGESSLTWIVDSPSYSGLVYIFVLLL